MFAMIKNLFAATLILFGTTAPCYPITMSDGQYYFRYKTTSSTAAPENPDHNKDIYATFLGAVDVPFQELLPLRADWEHDTWQVTKGSLPAGISFNPSTRYFSGSPAAEGTTTVELTGYDNGGNAIASAAVTFEFMKMVAVQPKVEFYAHTGKYSFNQLTLPVGVAVYRWDIINSAPPGIAIAGRNFDGTPTKAGIYPILIRGNDFDGNVVATFYGNFLVEDGPKFNYIADDLRGLPPFGNGQLFSYYPVPHATHTVDPSAMRYTVEVKDGDQLPGSIVTGSDPFNMWMSGWVFDYYDQASIRIKARDGDNTVGYSNWFKIGTAGAVPQCLPVSGSNLPIVGSVGSALSYGPVPLNDQRGSRTYEIAEGQLPEGVSLDKNTGIISGITTRLEKIDGVKIRITVLDGPSTTCGPYSFDIGPAIFGLTAENKTHVRVNQPFTGELVATGAIVGTPAISLDEGAVLPPGLQFDVAAGTVSGVPTAAGTYAPSFTLHNGNGYQKKAIMNVVVHDPLAVSDLPSPLSIKRLAMSNSIAKIAYDAAAVIPGPNAPEFKLVGGGLPEGLNFDASSGVISGGTEVPVGQYGPYKVSLTDGSGTSVETAEFFVDVTDRDPIDGTTQPLRPFAINYDDPGQIPFKASQPPIAANWPVTYTMSPSNLPDGLHFDTATGAISGTPTTKGTYPGFTVTVADSETSKTSDPFDIVVDDPPQPDAAPIPDAIGNRTGATQPAFRTAAVTFPAPDFEKTLIGGRDAVRFTSFEPTIAGLSLDAKTGVVSGAAKQTFDGFVTIHFVDGANRPGEEQVHITILPYPSVEMSKTQYDLPRFASANTIIPAPLLVEGFRSPVTFSLAAGSKPLPGGLTLGSDGTLLNSTSVAEGTVFSDIVIQATDVSSGITVQTPPFSIRVASRQPISLFPNPTSIDYFISQDGAVLDRVSAALGNMVPTGSWIAPLSYKIVSTPPVGLGLNSTTGQFTGWPRQLGHFTVTIAAVDGDGLSATADIAVNGRLAGNIQLSPGSIGPLNVRAGETFKTPVQTASNSDGVATFAAVGTLPTTVTLNEETGVFRGYLNSAGANLLQTQATDADGRTSAVAVFPVSVTPPLKIVGTTQTVTSKQFDPSQPINLTFPAAQNGLGNVVYGLSGSVPGTLIYRLYAGNQTGGDVSYVQINAVGDMVIIPADKLPLDAMVFDTLTRTLVGVPSKAGSFKVDVVAYDDYEASHYSVNPNDDTRTANNTASFGPYTFDVAQADDLTVSASTVSEQLYQFTSQPTLAYGVAGNAYGLPVTWTKISGDLASGLTANTGSTVLGINGYPTVTGTFQNPIWKVTDAAGRSVSTEATNFTIGPRQTFEAVASSNPRGMIVFKQDAALSVTPKNNSFGATINWNVAGTNNLPPGVSWKIDNNVVRFTGVSDQIGTYKDIIVSGTDSLGASASVNLTFRVLAPDDAIQLTVGDYTVKQGIPFTSNAPYGAPVVIGNTYGRVVVSSPDAPSQVTIDPVSGSLSGLFGDFGTIQFNMAVTDETDRLTSKPVKITVLPKMRILVASVIDVFQGGNTSFATDTDYAIGQVNYRSAGGLPAGITVDADTGTIVGSAQAKTGLYSGITIIGTDAVGDVQSSNTFAINVKPIQAKPVMGAVTIPLLTVGTKMDAVRPAVKDNVKGNVWDYDGDVFTISQALPAGLSIDPDTGTISGTPQTAVWMTGVTITVESELGDKSTSAPFDLKVQPAGDIVATAGQKTGFGFRATTLSSTGAPSFDNTFGTLTFSKVSGETFFTVNGSTGQVVATAPSAYVSGDPYPVEIKVTDQFGRTGTIKFQITISVGLSISQKGGIVPLNQVLTLGQPVISGVAGTAQFSFSGLPSGFTASPSGVISGRFTNVVEGTKFTVTETLTDTFDGATAQTTFTVSIGDGYYRVTFPTWVPHPTSPYCVGMSEATVYSNGVDVTGQTGVSAVSSDPTYILQNLTDKNLNSLWFSVDATTPKWIEFVPPVGQPINKIRFDWRRDGSTVCSPRSWVVERSDDGSNWTPLWNGATEPVLSGSFTTQP
jgi:hypothetical protein